MWNDRQNRNNGVYAAAAAKLVNGDYGAAESAYAKLAADLMDRREATAFRYDLYGDPLFRMLSESYLRQARRAADDAYAKAAARNGGYASTYAAAAADQQYHASLSGLYDSAPALLEAAYARYQNEQKDLLARAEYVGKLADKAYARRVAAQM